ncbi:hypothetical protein N431DRAFT_10945 [Stipitochalara longipes BDJ]|nr:hypothetical protein N431DRAFT_10945 [Stipitochalara longipes BDJ]
MLILQSPDRRPANQQTVAFPGPDWHALAALFPQLALALALALAIAIASPTKKCRPLEP